MPQCESASSNPIIQHEVTREETQRGPPPQPKVLPRGEINREAAKGAKKQRIGMSNDPVRCDGLRATALYFLRALGAFAVIRICSRLDEE